MENPFEPSQVLYQDPGFSLVTTVTQAIKSLLWRLSRTKGCVHTVMSSLHLSLSYHCFVAFCRWWLWMNVCSKLHNKWACIIMTLKMHCSRMVPGENISQFISNIYYYMNFWNLQTSLSWNMFIFCMYLNLTLTNNFSYYWYIFIDLTINNWYIITNYNKVQTISIFMPAFIPSLHTDRLFWTHSNFINNKILLHF